MKKNLLIILLAVALAALGFRYAYEHNSAAAESDASSGATSGASSDALECIMTRYSLRAYSPRQVSDTVTEQILRAGMAAPTAMNRQPWEMVVVSEQPLKDSIASMSRGASMVSEAPLVVAVCGNTQRFIDGESAAEGGFWIQDCSAATENMLLAAHALGLGGVWCGVYPSTERVARLKAILNLPDSIVPLNVVAIGYPKAEGAVKEKWNPARVHYNRF